MRGANLWMDTMSLNAAIVNCYKSACDRHLKIVGNKSKNNTSMFNASNGQSGEPTGVYKFSPISLAKAVKNHAELEGMRNSHLR